MCFLCYAGSIDLSERVLCVLLLVFSMQTANGLFVSSSAYNRSAKLELVRFLLLCAVERRKKVCCHQAETTMHCGLHRLTDVLQRRWN